jgi:hypothetical protein
VRRSRLSRWIVVGTLGALGLYFVLDVVALKYTESKGAAELAQAIAAEESSLRLGSVPFLPRFASGQLGGIQGKVRGATGPGGMRVSRVDVTLSDVRFAPWRVFALVRSRFSDRTTVKAGEVLVQVELAEQDLADYLRPKIASISEVKITNEGVGVKFERPNPDEETSRGPEDEDDEKKKEEDEPDARYVPRVENGEFKLIRAGLSSRAQQFREDSLRISELITLPKFPEGLRASIGLGDGVVVIEAAGRDVETSIGEAQT